MESLEPEEIAARLANAEPESGFSILQIREGRTGRILCRNSPLPFWVRGREETHFLVNLWFAWENGFLGGTGMRKARFEVQAGDYGVIIGERYLAATGYDWDRLAVSIRRWAETGCDAFQLRDCLLRTGQRLVRTSDQEMAVLAMRVRPLVSATIWTGPPLRREDDRAALDALMAEQGLRIICGDTTAQIAARLLGKPLRVDQSATPSRAQIPPLSYLEGVNLVTEGLITLRQATEWLHGAETVRDLPRSVDAATRLAYTLLSADRIHFVVGRAVNPAQAAGEGDIVSPRLAIVEKLVARLQAQGKIVYIAYL